MFFLFDPATESLTNIISLKRLIQCGHQEVNPVQTSEDLQYVQCVLLCVEENDTYNTGVQ